MIVFVHTEFGLVRIQESGIKRGGGRNPPPPQSERVFQIPVQIGLRIVINRIYSLLDLFVCLHV